MIARRHARWLVAALAAAILPLAPAGAGLLDPVTGSGGPLAVARDAEPVVLTGADVPEWSRLAAQGLAKPYPGGAPSEGASSGFPPGGDDVRSAHHGTITVPPDARTGAPVDRLAAYRWDGKNWTEVPVQVDERFPNFLANSRSDFGFYSGTDPHLTYAWDEEGWKKVAGECAARYPTAEEIPALVAAGIITPGAGETAEEHTGPKADPVPTLDDDDELVFMASDAGERAPADEDGPSVTDAGTRYEVTVVDPTSGNVSYVYLFQQEGGSTFDAATGYVTFTRDANADEYLDRRSFDDADPEKLGTSNTGYGPNLPGTVCRTSPQYSAELGIADGVSRPSTDRFPRDGLTVDTDAYHWRATGRWMVREVAVSKPGAPRTYGPDLVDRWKGRAFQQSPDSSISVVGFEDEQVNWEANSTVLGWRAGPVRAMREIWGADSGTNVTKMETFYRDGVAYRYRVRVHPIPPDGLYTSWDYNAGVAQTYYNALRPDGVPIDGVNDDTGQVDSVGGSPAFFDAPDPTFDLPSAVERWEQVAGAGDSGSLVYIFELMGPSSAVNFAAVPYYRDDKCLDDGTGDNPVARPWPGEPSTDSRVVAGYGAGATCDQKQGAWGAHGLHFFATGDSDNAFSPAPVTEIDGQQWQWAVPLDAPRNVGEAYAQVVRAKSKAIAAPQANEPAREGGGGPRGERPCPPEHANGEGPERCR